MTRTVGKQKKPDAHIRYTASPTCAKFHASNAHVRVLLGPVGCYDAQTEYLTKRGWRFMSEYDEGTEVAQVSDGVLSFVQPINRTVEPCESFIHFRSKTTVDMMVSENHHMYVCDTRVRNPRSYYPMTAAEVAASPRAFYIPTLFTVPGSGLPISDDDLRLMVAIHADGGYKSEGTHRCQMQFHKERKVNRLKHLLAHADIPYTLRLSERRNSSGKVVKVYTFVFYPPYKSKHYTDFWGASSRQLGIIIDECVRWDGDQDDTRSAYFTTHKPDADFIQYAAHASGRRASIRVTPPRGNRKALYTVNITRRETSHRNVVTIHPREDVYERVASPDGMQYCFTVPSGELLVRRNGFVFISGNSGKSSATWLELFRRACSELPNDAGVRSSVHLVVRDTYAQLKTTSIRDFMSWFGRVATVVYDSPVRGRVDMELPDGTRLDWNVWFLSMDGGDASLDTLRGMSITAAYVNEGHTIAKEVYEVLNTRIGRYSSVGSNPEWKGIIVDSNFGYSGCHLHTKYNDGDPDWEFFEQPPAAIYNTSTGRYELNPQAENIANVPNGFDYYLKMLGMSVEFIKQFLANGWATRQSGKLVYNEYSTSLHSHRGSIRPDQFLPILIGQDFGFHVGSVIGQLTPSGKLVVIKELYDDDMDLYTFLETVLIPWLRANVPNNPVYMCGDPSGENRSAHDSRTAFDILRKYGIKAYPAVSNAFITRRNAVVKFLTRIDGFKISAVDCPRLVAGFDGGYGYKKKSDGTGYYDYVEKNIYSHVHDALQYLAMFCCYGNTRVTNPKAQMEKARKRVGKPRTRSRDKSWTG